MFIRMNNAPQKIVTKDQLFAIAHGECSDYCIRAVVSALKDFDLFEVFRAYLETKRPKIETSGPVRVGNFGLLSGPKNVDPPDDSEVIADFSPYLVEQGLVRTVRVAECLLDHTGAETFPRPWGDSDEAVVNGQDGWEITFSDLSIIGSDGKDDASTFIPLNPA